MKELRNDFTDALVHFTRERTGNLIQAQADDISENDASYCSLEVLCQILELGKIIGSNNKGFVKGADTAVCFTECPLSAVKLFASGPEVENAKYRFYGIAISKKASFENGVRPVIYLPDDEGDWIPSSEKWRHVRFEYGSVDWTFEREWRKKGDLELKRLPGFYIMHWCPTEKKALENSLHKDIQKKVRGYLPMKHLNQML